MHHNEYTPPSQLIVIQVAPQTVRLSAAKLRFNGYCVQYGRRLSCMVSSPVVPQSRECLPSKLQTRQQWTLDVNVPPFWYHFRGVLLYAHPGVRV